MKKSIVLLSILLFALPLSIRAYVQVYDIYEECLVPEWNTVNSLSNSSCWFNSINFLGRNIEFSTYAQSVFLDDDSLIVHPANRTIGLVASWGTRINLSGDLATGYSAGDLISEANTVQFFGGDHGILGIEQFIIGEAWPGAEPSFQMVEEQYIGFTVEVNGLEHNGWLKWGFDYNWTQEPVMTGIVVERIGIETTPGLGIIAGSEETYFIGGPYSLTGHTFLDSNENGLLDSDEPLTENTSINIASSSGQIIGLEQGNPYEYSVIAGSYSVSTNYDSSLWSLTTTEHYDISLDNSNTSESGLDFGLTPIGQQEIVDASITAQNARCGFVRTHTLTISNEGNTQPSGVIRYELDTLCTLAGGTPPDSVVNQYVYFSYDSLDYFGSTTRYVDVQIPDFNSEGSNLNFHLRLWDDQGNSIYEEYIQQTVSCSYDPNDKTEYNGYTDNGFINPGDELEYLIRFQNTGSDTAYNVLLLDELSPLLDLSSFEMTACSHPCQTLLDDDGNLNIIFDNIYLPDSIVDEPASHGFFRYNIRASSSLSPGDVIENTAEIYFDFNPAIVTNTTVNEVFDCTTLADFALDDEVCFGSYFEAIASSQWIEEYSWEMDGMEISQDQLLILQSEAAGDHELTLIATNPLCETEHSRIITVRPELTADAGLDQSYCNVLTGEIQSVAGPTAGAWSAPLGISIVDPNSGTTEITADSPGSYEMIWTVSDSVCDVSDEVLITFLEAEWVELVQNGNQLNANTFSPGPFTWFLNGVAIPGATESQYTPLESGTYTVDVVGFNGCLALSNDLLFSINGVEEFDINQVSISPNPFSEILTVRIADWGGESYTLELLDETGRMVTSMIAQAATVDIDRSHLAAGHYTLRVMMQGKAPLLIQVMAID